MYSVQNDFFYFFIFGIWNRGRGGGVMSNYFILYEKMNVRNAPVTLQLAILCDVVPLSGVKMSNIARQMVAPMIAAYCLNGCLQTDIYNYHDFFLVLDKYVS